MLRRAVEQLAEACASGAPFVDAYNKVFAEGERASVQERNEAIDTLLSLKIEHPELAGYVCVATGGLVQMGASTTIGFDRILDAIAQGAALLAAAGDALERADLDGDVAPPKELTRDERRWVAAFKLHVRGAMARLARDVAARKSARAHEAFDRSVRALHERAGAHHTRYLVEVLDMLDDALVTLIDLPQERVSRVRVFGVRNGFHFTTLLDGKDPFALEEDGARDVSAEHGYFCWPALAKKDGRFVTEGVGDMLWGEMRSMDVPQFEGSRVVIRTPKVFGSRSWGFSFVAPIHDALREELRVEAVLSVEEGRALMERILVAAGR